MLLQTNSYIVPKDKRSEHLRLLQRFRQTLARLGCEHFETYEQVGANWSGSDSTGRFVQLMRFRDRRQQQQVQAAERNDPMAQALIKEFCELINFPYQQQQGLFAVGFYQGAAVTTSPLRQPPSVLTTDAVLPASAGGNADDEDLLAAEAAKAEAGESATDFVDVEPTDATVHSGDDLDGSGLNAAGERGVLSDNLATTSDAPHTSGDEVEADRQR